MKLTNCSITFRTLAEIFVVMLPLSSLLKQKIAIYKLLQVIIQYTFFYIVQLEVYINKNFCFFTIYKKHK